MNPWRRLLREMWRRLHQPRFLAVVLSGYALDALLVRLVPNFALLVVTVAVVNVAAAAFGCWWADQDDDDDDDDDDGHRETAPERDAETPEARRWRLTGVPA